MDTTLEQKLEETGKFIREYNKVPLEDRIEELLRPRFIIDIPVGIDYINQQNFRNIYTFTEKLTLEQQIFLSPKYRWFFDDDRYRDSLDRLFDFKFLSERKRSCLIPV